LAWGMVAGLWGEKDEGSDFRDHGKLILGTESFLVLMEIWKMKQEIS